MKKIIVCITVLMMTVLCACGSEAVTYQATSMHGVEVDIPSICEVANDSDGYKEFVSEKTDDAVMLCYFEDDGYEAVVKDTWDSLVEAEKSDGNFTDLKQSEIEIDGVKGHIIQFVYKEYSSALLLLPLEKGYITISVYIEDDEISAHVIDSIKFVD